MIKAVIIDDEQHCIDRVEHLLLPYKNVISLIGKFTTVESGIEGVKNLNPDVIFLDVQIHDQTGFDILKALDHYPFEVIFTTAFETYAVQAFKFSAIDYLLKPIETDDFKLAIDKLSQKIEAKDFSQKVDHLLSNVSKNDLQKRISIPTVDGLEFIKVSDIIRCEANVNYTTIFSRNKQKLMVSKTLKHFEMLFCDCNFFRVHNSHLINLDYIKKYTKGKGGYITMIDGTNIEVSIRRKDAFLKLFN